MNTSAETPAAHAPPRTSWRLLAVRLLLSAGLLYCIYLSATQGLAEWYFRQPAPEGPRQAIRLNPRNPHYYAGLANFHLRSFERYDLPEAIRLYETAVRLSPQRARYWAELGGAYELADRQAEAVRAYERARELFPNSPRLNWQLGNFYLRAGRVNEAVRVFQKSVIGDAALRRPAFDLAWRAGADPETILREMIPASADLHVAYLNFLAETNRMDAARACWERLLELNRPFEPQAAFFYLDALVREHRVDELGAAWAALARRNPTRIRQPVFDSNLLLNGGFESEILNGGLDWRVVPLEGVVVRVNNLTFFDGTHSLEVRFDGKHNLEYGHVLQYVVVKPNADYRLTAYLRAQGITTDSGPRLQVYDPYDPARLFLSTDGLVATSGWAPYQLAFRTGPETRLLLVRLARSPSRKFDNQIAGTLWLDRVSLNLLE